MGFQYNQNVGDSPARLAFMAGQERGRQREEELALERNAQAMTMREYMLKEKQLKAQTELAYAELDMRQQEADIESSMNELRRQKMILEIGGYETPAQQREAEAQTTTKTYEAKKNIDVASDIRREMGLEATERSQAEIAKIRSDTARTDIDTYLKSLEAVYTPEMLEAKRREAEIKLSNLEYESSAERRKMEDQILTAKLDDLMLGNQKLREEMYFSGDAKELDLETKKEVLRQLKAKGAITPQKELEMDIALYQAKKKEDLKYEVNKSVAMASLAAKGIGGKGTIKEQKEIELLQKKIDSWGRLSDKDRLLAYQKYLDIYNKASYYLASDEDQDIIYGESLKQAAENLGMYMAQMQTAPSSSSASNTTSVNLSSVSDEDLERAYVLAKKSGRSDYISLIVAEAKRRANR